MTLTLATNFKHAASAFCARAKCEKFPNVAVANQAILVTLHLQGLAKNKINPDFIIKAAQAEIAKLEAMLKTAGS